MISDVSDVSVNKPKLITLDKLKSILISKGASCSCGYKFTQNDFRCYSHNHGVKLADYKEKQWVYAHCNRCDYDMALWKIINSLEFN